MSAKVLELTAENFDREVAGGTVLVKFGAEWCPPCKIVEPVLEGIAGEFAGRVRVVTVDADRSPELVRRFGVQALPTFVVYREGVVAFRQSGLMARRVLLERLGLGVSVAG